MPNHHHPSFPLGKLTDLFKIFCAQRLYKQITSYCHMTPYFIPNPVISTPKLSQSNSQMFTKWLPLWNVPFFQKTGRSREGQIKAVSWPPALSSVPVQNLSFVSKSGSYHRVFQFIYWRGLKLLGNLVFLVKICLLKFQSREIKLKSSLKPQKRQMNPLSCTSSSASLFCFFSSFFLLLLS